MINLIRLGYKTNKFSVSIPYHNYCLRILDIFYEEGYIISYQIINNSKIIINLKYCDHKPMIKSLKFFFWVR